MKLDQKENVIREKRMIQATQKNLMGPSGKFGAILHAFGETITRQGSGLVDTRYLDDPYDDYVYTEYASSLSGGGPAVYRDEILDFEDVALHDEGLMYDGLSHGLHLEIVYWHDINEIKVSYKGVTVYSETAGELSTYNPFPEWEDKVEKLYRRAKDRLSVLKGIEDERHMAVAERRKQSFLERMGIKWGI